MILISPETNFLNQINGPKIMKEIKARCIGHSIAARGRLTSQFIRDSAELKKNDDALSESLLTRAPESLHKWLVESELLYLLLEYGIVQSKITFGDSPFNGMKQTRATMRELTKAWPGIVKIKFRCPVPHCVDVEFSALM